VVVAPISIPQMNNTTKIVQQIVQPIKEEIKEEAKR
jgi:hypothetical protein